jgi:hypothetical protein
MYIATQLARHKFSLILATVAILGLMLSPVSVGASSHGDGLIDPTDTFGLNPIQTTTDLGKDKSLQETVASLINVALSLLGIVAVVIILAGGFMWMTAGGNDEKVAGARKLIFSGIIGLAIIMSAWAITRFVFEALNSATGSGDISGSFTNG